MKPQLSEVHPELQAGAAKVPQLTYNNWTVKVIRWLTRLQPLPKVPETVSIENVYIPVPDSQAKLRLRIYKPKSIAALTPVLVWLHGGGYIIGRPEIAEDACIRFVHELGIIVVSVDYRLAPDYPFPHFTKNERSIMILIFSRSDLS